MSLFLNREDGYYSLTIAGTALLITVMIILILLTALVAFGTEDNPGNDISKNEAAKKAPKVFNARRLVFSATAVALGFIASYIKIFHLPWGGSVTLCSMLFITLIGYWYGPKVGISAAFAYSLLQFIQNGGSYILSPLQALMDYIFAFAALGLSGFFSNKKHGLIKGYIFAVLMRGLFHTIGGYLYWMDYMPDSFPQSLAIIYPIAYNYSYILAEALITVIILMLPPVKNAMSRIRRIAME